MISGSVRPLARSALAAALGIVVLYLGSVLPTAKLTLLCLSTLGVVLIRVSCSIRWALCCYAVTAMAGLLLLPEKSAAVLYTALLGYYPIVKLWAERLRRPVFRWSVKLAVFNAAALSVYFFFSAVFTELTGPFSTAPWLLLAAGNVVFAVYDYALGVLILFYLRNLARRLK